MLLPAEPDDEPQFDAEPEPWRPPARCPSCGGVQTQFMALQHEMSVYECQNCGTEFELEEPE